MQMHLLVKIISSKPKHWKVFLFAMQFIWDLIWQHCFLVKWQKSKKSHLYGMKYCAEGLKTHLIKNWSNSIFPPTINLNCRRMEQLFLACLKVSVLTSLPTRPTPAVPVVAMIRSTLILWSLLQVTLTSPPINQNPALEVVWLWVHIFLTGVSFFHHRLTVPQVILNLLSILHLSTETNKR